MKKLASLSLLCFLFVCQVSSQKNEIDASKVNNTLKNTPFKMGNPGLPGKEIKINNLYMTIGGKPVIPVMGEMQYARIPRVQWEEDIMRMKACGVNIISSYVFWNHHEEIEGQFDWAGQRDMRAFIQLCGKHGMMVFMRIGPWCNGETRNGGTPDWLITKLNVNIRTNHPVYMQYVDRLYNQIGAQMKGLYYKDGGPVMGIQFENEYEGGKNGEDHIRWLKETAMKYGVDVPIYTITGWGNVSLPKYEAIPMTGGYPDAPWELHTEKIFTEFGFNTSRENKNLGKIDEKKSKDALEDTNYPYFACEMGVGIHNAEHRRVIINPLDGYAMASFSVGSGCNLLGYYIFSGGSNPHSILNSFTDNRLETGGNFNLAYISYDFQAAIRESGELNQNYYLIKKLHYFLNEFGDHLAPTATFIGANGDNLSYSFREKDNSGFVFGVNYARYRQKPVCKGFQLGIKLQNEKITLPNTPIDIPDSTLFIWPVNFDMNGATLKSATAQPLCKIDLKNKQAWVFIQNTKASPEFCFDKSTVDNLKTSNGTISGSGNLAIINKLKPGTDCSISFQNKKGEEQVIIVLTEEEAKHAWLFNENGKKSFFLSNANLCMDNNRLHVFGPDESVTIKSLTDYPIVMPDGNKLSSTPKGLFYEYSYNFLKKEIKAELKRKTILDDALWLKTSVDKITKDNNVASRIFVKEFNVGNPSRIKSATLYLATEYSCKLEANFTLVNQKIKPNELNSIDLTGYLKNGENKLFVIFPTHEGDKAFAARVVIDFFNTDRIEFFSDNSWQNYLGTNYPPIWGGKIGNLKAPEITTERPALNKTIPELSEYSLSLPYNYLDGLNNAYLKVSYFGDKAYSRLNQLMLGDDLNSNVPWSIGLKRYGNQVEVQNMKFEIISFTADSRVYLDKPFAPADFTKAEIRELKIVPEYKVILEVK